MDSLKHCIYDTSINQQFRWGSYNQRLSAATQLSELAHLLFYVCLEIDPVSEFISISFINW